VTLHAGEESASTKTSVRVFEGQDPVYSRGVGFRLRAENMNLSLDLRDTDNMQDNHVQMAAGGVLCGDLASPPPELDTGGAAAAVSSEQSGQASMPRLLQTSSPSACKPPQLPPQFIESSSERVFSQRLDSVQGKVSALLSKPRRFSDAVLSVPQAINRNHRSMSCSPLLSIDLMLGLGTESLLSPLISEEVDQDNYSHLDLIQGVCPFQAELPVPELNVKALDDDGMGRPLLLLVFLAASYTLYCWHT